MTSERFFGLIPAAGAGARMGQELAKQYLMLAGQPMLYHSVNALLASGRVALPVGHGVSSSRSVTKPSPRFT